MRLSKQRKILIGVLGSGLAALAVDRFVLGSRLSATSEASAAETVVPGTAETGEMAGTEELPAGAAVGVAERLAQFAAARPVDFEGVPDIFEPSDIWLPEEPEPEPEPEPELGPSPGEEFKRRHRVTALLIGGASPVAVVDGVSSVRVGETFDGFVLASVSEDAAVFRSADEEIVLTLAEAGLPAAGGR